MNRKQLTEQIFAKKSFLCVGLDTDTKKMPAHLLSKEEPIFEFNKAIIDATAPYCVAYKPNLLRSVWHQGHDSLRKNHQVSQRELS